MSRPTSRSARSATSRAGAAAASPQSAAFSTAAEASTHSDRERAGLVRARDAPGALGAVEAHALRRAERLVAQLRIGDAAREDRTQERTGDAVRHELVLREKGKAGNGTAGNWNAGNWNTGNWERGTGRQRGRGNGLTGSGLRGSALRTDDPEAGSVVAHRGLLSPARRSPR